ncbi:MAG: hypothetical protein ABR562_03500 [Thermoplasmatota archaeon]
MLRARPPRAPPLQPPRTAKPRRKGGGAAVAIAFLLLAGGLGTLGYVLLTQPGADGFLSFSSLTASDAGRGPTDYQPPVASDGVFHRDFEWSFKGRTYTWSMNLTTASYDYFHDMHRPERRYQEKGVWHVQAAYDIYVSSRDDDPFVNALAATLLNESRREGFSDDEALSFALAFVQSLQYTSDAVTTGFDEWPRFPVETLVDNGGDCEDTSILYASLVQAMGYGVILVSPPGHMAVAVAADPGFGGLKYHYGTQDYAYAETTGDGYAIGEIPSEYEGKEVAVYDLTPKPLFALKLTFGDVTRDGYQEISLKATQTGSAPAYGVQLMADVGTTGVTYDTEHCDAGDVQPGVVVQCRLRLDLNKVPRGARVTIRNFVQDRDYVYDEMDSTPWCPRPPCSG